MELGVDGVALVQESAPLRDGHIVRVETLGGKYLYAIKVFPAVGSFDLCPADACQTTNGVELVRGACAVDAPKTGLRVEGYTPPAEIIAAGRSDLAPRRPRHRRHRVPRRRSRRQALLLRHQRALELRRRSRRTSSASIRGSKFVDYLEKRVARGERQNSASLASRDASPVNRGRTAATAMRYGYWLPVFGGWLRNVEDEGMAASWEYVKRLAQRSEEIGFDLTLIAELLLNDIKGIQAPSLDAWSTAAALAAVTERLELMVAVRPSFHPPAILAKQAANIDRISNGRLALNVVSAWWKDEARRYGAAFDEHDDRYARTKEWLDVVDGAWSEADVQLSRQVLQPRRPRARAQAGRARRAAPSDDLRRRRIGDGEDADRAPVRRVRHARRSAGADRAEDRRHAQRRERASEALGVELPPMQFGVAAYAIVRDTEREVKAEIERITNVTAGSPGYGNYRDWIANTKLEQQVSLAGLLGVESRSARRAGGHAGPGGRARWRSSPTAGVDLLLLQCSPQLEEMERFADSVIAARV